MKLSPVSESARTPAPAYLDKGNALWRIDEGGSRRIEPPARATTQSDWTTYSAGPFGTLWMTREDGVFVLGPTDRAMRRVAPAPWQQWPAAAIVRSETEKWAFRSGFMAHYDGTHWTEHALNDIFGSTYVSPVLNQDGLWVAASGQIWKCSRGSCVSHARCRARPRPSGA